MIVGHIGGSSESYQVEKSLRLRSEVSARITRAYTNAVADTDNKKKTYSLWIRLGDLDTSRTIIGNSISSSNFWVANFNTNGSISLQNRSSDTYTLTKTTTRLFRDPSRPYHIHIKVDTTQAVAEDRFILTVNGERITSFSPNTVAAQNSSAMAFLAPSSGTWTAAFGYTHFNAANLTGGAVSEIHVVDGSAVDADQFGEFNSYGQWVPKAYNGTHGANGFYLPFDDGTDLTELCRDRSGNGKDFTATGVSLTAGTTYDWLDDTATNVFATLSPLDSGGALSGGNLRHSSATTSANSRSTIGISSGKWYWEFSPETASTSTLCGICNASLGVTTYPALNANAWIYAGNGQKANGSLTAYGASFTNTNVTGVAFDADAGTLEFFVDGVSQGVAFSGIPPATYFAVVGQTSNVSLVSNINFGQRPFAYAPPAGYKALCTANMPEPTGAAANPKAHMTTVTYVGDGSLQGIVTDANDDPLEFKADLIWVKSRSAATNNILSGDGVDPNQGYLVSNSTAAVVSPSNAPGMTSEPQLFVDNTLAGTNANLVSYVAWLFKMGNSFVANTDGSISSQVSANTVGGMSIVEYTGTGANATVGHGLGAAPKLIIIKRLDGVSAWQVGHDAAGWTKYLRLDNADATATNATAWNNTAPTSSVFSLGSGTIANTSGASYIAICFAEVPGFSKIGSYTGNGSADGPFIHLGFKPRFLLIKRTDAANSWLIKDSGRNAHNQVDNNLLANSALQENEATTVGSSAVNEMDFVASGVKLRDAHGHSNANGGTYVFLAIPEQPFKRTNAQ